MLNNSFKPQFGLFAQMDQNRLGGERPHYIFDEKRLAVSSRTAIYEVKNEGNKNNKDDKGSR